MKKRIEKRKMDAKKVEEKEMRNHLIRHLYAKNWRPGRIAAVMHITRTTVMNVLYEGKEKK